MVPRDRCAVVGSNDAPKNHYLLHLAHRARRMSPNLGWCYQGEDLMHRIKVLAMSSFHGTGPRKFGTKSLAKYLVTLGLTMSQVQFWSCIVQKDVSFTAGDMQTLFERRAGQRNTNSNTWGLALLDFLWNSHCFCLSKMNIHISSCVARFLVWPLLQGQKIK